MTILVTLIDGRQFLLVTRVRIDPNYGTPRQHSWAEEIATGRRSTVRTAWTWDHERAEVNMRLGLRELLDSEGAEA